jgi:cytochrome c biogenesis protein CcdA
MLIKKYFLIGLIFIILSPIFVQADSAELPKLIVFHSPTCHKCIQAKDELMPGIEREFKGEIQIEYRDIGDIENYKFLLGIQEKHNIKDLSDTLPIFYINGRFLNGDRELKSELKDFIATALNLSVVGNHVLPEVDLVARFKNFKAPAIIGAGLIDGINPCAFTVIVFFISFLALQGYRKKELIIIGLAFIFAVFLTYILIGLGLFGFLYSLRGFWFLIRIFNFLLGMFSVALGIFCIYDIFKFKKTKTTEGMALQLPQAVKNQIHRVIGLHYRINRNLEPEENGQGRRIFSLTLGTLLTGFLVSILEAICTGQVYLPTIAFVFKTSHLKLEALAYLVLYNTMFVVPLFAVFLLALLGITSQQFSQAFKRHILTVKMLMAVLFFVLGIFLIWRV